MKRFGIFLLITFVGFFISSFLYSSHPTFGFPYAVYLFPFDCGYNRDPNFMCEGFIWMGILKDSIIWLAISVLLVHIYKLRRKFIPGKKLIKIIPLICFIILIIVGVFIFFNVSKGYLNGNIGNQKYCGGFEGKVCSLGYYCPDSRYPDELKKCVSFFEFFKSR